MSNFIDDNQISLFQANNDEYFICDAWNSSKIHLRKCYSLGQVKSTIADYFDDDSKAFKKLLNVNTIIIKVNLTSPELPEEGKTTSPQILSCLLDYFKDNKIDNSRIYVIDSSVIGIDTNKAAKICGIKDVCNKYGITFMDLNSEGEFLDVSVKTPKIQKFISVHSFWFSSNSFQINLAKIKTTYGSPVGLSIKNMKGIISDKSKLLFHHNGLQESLVDLHSIINSDLNILEGFPSSQLGKAKECGVIGISNNSLLLDCLITELIGVTVANVPHLKMILQSKALNIEKIINDYQFIKLKGNVPNLSFSIHGIKDIGNNYGISIIEGTTCSGCVESFNKAIRRLLKEIIIPDNIVFLLGDNAKGPLTFNDSSYKIIKIGNCSVGKGRISKLNKNNSKCHVNANNKEYNKGCPPTIDSIVKNVKTLINSNYNKIGNIQDESYKLNTPFSTTKDSSYIYSCLKILPMFSELTAKVIRDVSKHTPKEKVTFNSLGQELAIQCELATSAICHQINWDFLRLRIFEKVLQNKNYFSFTNIQKIGKIDIEELLSGYHDKDRIKASERASMLRSLYDLNTKTNDYFINYLNETDNYLNGKSGLLSILKRSTVFSKDLEMKKAQVFVQSLIGNGIWDCNDPGWIKPAVDYHIMRLNIRRGNLWPINSLGDLYIRSSVNRLSVTTSAVRYIIAQGLKDISAIAGLSILDVNASEWWIGRSVCLKEKPDCYLEGDSSGWLKNTYEICPYSEICFAFNNDNSLLSVTEPKEQSKFY